MQIVWSQNLVLQMLPSSSRISQPPARTRLDGRTIDIKHQKYRGKEKEGEMEVRGRPLPPISPSLSFLSLRGKEGEREVQGKNLPSLASHRYEVYSESRVPMSVDGCTDACMDTHLHMV